MLTTVCSNPQCQDFGKALYPDEDGMAICEECSGRGIQIPINPHEETWIALLEEMKASRDYYKKKSIILEEKIKSYETAFEEKCF